MISKFISLRNAGLAFLAAVIITSSAVGASVKVFADVSVSHPNVDAISQLSGIGVIFGDGDSGNFAPDRTLNRAEYSIMIARAEGWDLENVQYKATFPDVKEGEWYTNAILKANEEGVLKGTGDGLAEPGRNVLMIEALAMTMRAYKITVPTPTGSQAWFDPYLDLAADAGLDTLVTTQHDKDLPRDEAAQLLFNAISEFKPMLLEDDSPAADTDADSGANEENVVIYTANGYEPSTLTIKAGETVTFKNESGQSMWTASNVHPSHTLYDGQNLDAHCPDTAGTAFDQCATGDEYSFTFTKAGSWGYHNHISSNHMGTIVVEADPEPVAAQLALTSSAFVEGGDIPAVYSCDEDNVHPPLTISGAPAGTKSFAIIMDDPDAVHVIGEIAYHWVVWNIPAGTTSLAAGTLPSGAITGMGLEEGKYIGPCPPENDPHTYRFHLYALDKVLDLTATSTTHTELEAAMEGAVLAEFVLSGEYTFGG